MTNRKNSDTVRAKGGRPPKKAMGKLGKRVRERRGELGLTLSQLAARSRVSESAISLIERDMRPRVGLDTAAKLAKGLGWTVDDLIKANGNK